MRDERWKVTDLPNICIKAIDPVFEPFVSPGVINQCVGGIKYRDHALSVSEALEQFT